MSGKGTRPISFCYIELDNEWQLHARCGPKLSRAVCPSRRQPVIRSAGQSGCQDT